MSMSGILLKAVAAKDAQRLRDSVLRAKFTPGASVYDGDEDHGTLHIGALFGDLFVGVATVSHSPFPGGSSQQAWRLRGMAILPAWQRKGLGSRLVEACLRHANDHGATMIWCSARSEAFSFYESFGFRVLGPLRKREGYGDMEFAFMTLSPTCSCL